MTVGRVKGKAYRHKPASEVFGSLATTVFNCLKGNWVLYRFKDDVELAKAKASFSLKNDNLNSLLYHEEGSAVITDQRKFDFYRDYEYRLNQETIDVFFINANEQNKLFHSLDFVRQANGLLVASAKHQCADDIYKINYKLNFPNELIITY